MITKIFEPLEFDCILSVTKDLVNILYTFSHHFIQMTVEFDRFYDADIEDMMDKYAVIDHYEWAITDNSLHEKTLTKWTKVVDTGAIEDRVSSLFPFLFTATEFEPTCNSASRVCKINSSTAIGDNNRLLQTA